MFGGTGGGYLTLLSKFPFGFFHGLFYRGLFLHLYLLLLFLRIHVGLGIFFFFSFQLAIAKYM